METLNYQLSVESIMARIYEIRGQKVMLDKDLAALYGVSTGNLNKSVNRNIQRFPADFMFELSASEWEGLKPMVESTVWGGTRKAPKVFTEQGVAMLSDVLSSDRAIQVNIQIMRAYCKMRALMFTHQDLLLKMEAIEKRMTGQDEQVALVFDYLRQFVREKQQPRKQIGYRIEYDDTDEIDY